MKNAELLTRVCDGYVVVALCGELDAAGAESAASAVAALTMDGRPLIIDLETLAYIDCHAVGALLSARKAARLAGGDVLLAAPRGPVERLLSLLGVRGVHVTVAAAAASAGKRGARQRAVSSARAGIGSWSPRWLRARIGSRG